MADARSTTENAWSRLEQLVEGGRIGGCVVPGAHWCDPGEGWLWIDPDVDGSRTRALADWVERATGVAPLRVEAVELAEGGAAGDDGTEAAPRALAPSGTATSGPSRRRRAARRTAATGRKAAVSRLAVCYAGAAFVDVLRELARGTQAPAECGSRRAECGSRRAEVGPRLPEHGSDELAASCSPGVLLLMRAVELAAEVVAHGDVLAFAAPAGSSFADVSRLCFRLGENRDESWVPWSAQADAFAAAWLPAWSRPELRAWRFTCAGWADRVHRVDRVDWEQPVARGAVDGHPPRPGRPSRLGQAGEPQFAGEILPASRAGELWFDWWLCSLVDHFTRLTLQPLSHLPAPALADAGQRRTFRVAYRGEEELLERWRRALWADRRSTPDGHLFAGDGWLVWHILKPAFAASGWRREWLRDRSGRAFYHLQLELAPPDSGWPGAAWRLVYAIKHNHRPLSAPLADWWAQPGRVWQIGADLLERPDAWILPQLWAVGRQFEPVARSLGRPAPDGCALTVDEVLQLAADRLKSLRGLGVEVSVPDLHLSEAGDVRIRVQVRRWPGRRHGRGGQRPAGWFRADQLVEFDWTVVVDNQELPRDEFERLVEQQSPLVQLGGSWRLVPLGLIVQQIRLFEEAGRSGTAPLLPLSRALLLAQADERVPVEVVTPEAEGQGEAGADAQGVQEALPNPLQVVRTLLRAGEAPQLPPPAGFCGTLRQYQQYGYSWLVHLRKVGFGACLADDMGLGKTVQVIACLLHLKEAGAAEGPHLLLCPTSLLPNWRSEVARFAPSLRVYVHHGASRVTQPHAFQRDIGGADLVLTTYATAVRDRELLRTVDWDTVIADEAQNIKNPDTKQSKAVCELPSRHRIALTGTPVENRLEELWAIFRFTNPGYLGSLSWFRRTFVTPVSARPDSRAGRALQRLLAPVLLRRRKTEASIQMELPDKWETSQYAALTVEQAALYQSVVERLFHGIGEAADGMSRRGQILSALVRLKQVCDHPCLLVGGRKDPGRSGKFKLLLELLDEVRERGESALVFTQFRDMGELLCDALEARWGTRPQFLHGGLGAAQRGALVEAFQTGRDPSAVLVLSLKAGGVGLNLTRANHVFHYDRWWNPAVEDQATDRVFRIGQSKNVQVHKLVCAGTLEERIDQMIAAKRALSNAVVGASEHWVTELDDHALRELFALDPDAAWMDSSAGDEVDAGGEPA